MDILTLLADERLALADVLDSLTAEQWDCASLSAGWSVRHVVAHLLMPFRYSAPKFAVRLLLARGNFNRMADRVAQRDASQPTSELVGQLRSNAANTWTPPGAGYEAPLTDLVMHSLDICRPLGIERSRPAAVNELVLNNLVTSQATKFFGLDLTGLELTADDLDWTFGSGAAVRGPADDLILALGGRPAGIAGLEGEGVRVLEAQRRLSPCRS